MPESSVQEAVLRLARQLKLIPTAPPGNPGPAYHSGPEWPVQSLSDAATVPAQFFGELLRGLMDPLGANNQAPVENIGALLGAAMPLAGGLRGLRAGQLAEEAATAGRATKGAQGIKAYHGSPHDFDQFSLSKIGTGEGAQAYGHGLYFAENEGVARSYRDTLTQNRVASAKRALAASGGDPDFAIAEARAQIERLKALPNGGGDVGRQQRQIALQEEKIAELVALKKSGDMSSGRMYEVNLKVDPEQLLDWDKPLSEQPRVVEMLKSRGYKDAPWPYANKLMHPDGGTFIDLNDAGESAYRGLTNLIRDTGSPMPGARLDARASGELVKSGIPGIKYLDGGSRAAGEGSRNYVIFDDSLVDILKKYGVALPAIEVLRRKAQANNGTVPANDVHGLIGS